MRTICNSHGVDVIILQETKLICVQPSLIKEISCFHNSRWCLLPTFGRGRGILIIWDKKHGDSMDSVIGAFRSRLLPIP